ncbi:unnamed protein product [Caenorhabditis auriculariae]|uniref:Uncharacterized protein n=1 Tax=Caenorhabditis auriculariae TaxID=2777116 RepID=A0A8S1HBS4_9PELO|nr:unnamed protein product [Caenorhabditis auriculariae]
MRIRLFRQSFQPLFVAEERRPTRWNKANVRRVCGTCAVLLQVLVAAECRLPELRVVPHEVTMTVSAFCNSPLWLLHAMNDVSALL